MAFALISLNASYFRISYAHRVHRAHVHSGGRQGLLVHSVHCFAVNSPQSRRMLELFLYCTRIGQPVDGCTLSLSLAQRRANEAQTHERTTQIQIHPFTLH